MADIKQPLIANKQLRLAYEERCRSIEIQQRSKEQLRAELNQVKQSCKNHEVENNLANMDFISQIKRLEAENKSNLPEKYIQLQAENKKLLQYLKDNSDCDICKYRHLTTREAEEFKEHCAGCVGNANCVPVRNNWEISEQALKEKNVNG